MAKQHQHRNKPYTERAGGHGVSIPQGLPASVNALLSDSIDLARQIPETRNPEVLAAARKIIEAHHEDPQAIIAHIRQTGTPVWVMPQRFGLTNPCKGALKLLGFEPGFIPPEKTWTFHSLTQGLKGMRVSGCEDAQQAGVVVLTPGLCSVSYLAHVLYHCLSYHAGLEGYSLPSRRLYRRFLQDQKQVMEKDMHKMSLQEALDLQSAIRRDMEALCFVRTVTLEIFVPAGQSSQLAQGATSA